MATSARWTADGGSTVFYLPADKWRDHARRMHAERELAFVFATIAGIYREVVTMRRPKEKTQKKRKG